MQDVIYCDVNCDLGEGFGAYSLGSDEAIMAHISSANIACGFHAGDPLVMKKAIQWTMDHGVGIGAHPGYPDLQGFGRRSLQMGSDELFAAILYQAGALKSMTEALGGKMRHVKPHGALYNTAAADFQVARAIASAVYALDPSLILVGLPGSQMEHAASQAGLPFAGEAFADRAYNDDGTLVSRSNPGAVIHDPAILTERLIRFVKEKTVVSITGTIIPVKADTICIHGDNKSALEFAQSLGQVFKKQRICLKPMGEK